jgi:hypothetical protein
MATLQYTRKFCFRINGQINMSGVQFGALQDFFSDNVTLQAHAHVIAEKENIHVVEIPEEKRNLGDLCGWLSFFLEKLNEVRAICEKAEKDLLKI